MKNVEYIINLLEKENLSEEEKKNLNDLLNQDHDLIKYLRLYEKLKLAGSITHPDTEMLGEYVLYTNGFLKDNEKVIPHIPLIETHLRECKRCEAEFKLFNSEFTSIDEFIASKFSNAGKEKKSYIKSFLFNSSFTGLKYSLASIFIIGIVYIALLAVSSTSLSNVQQLADYAAKTEYYITRGRATDEFQKSMIALENGNYKRTIEFLKQDIQNNNKDETVFYSYYILGLVYLEDADVNFLGLFPSYDTGKATQAVMNFKEAVKLNRSDEFMNINYDAFYFIGKGYLMLDKKEQAVNYFKLVINNKGSKSEEAKYILDELE